ncbi:uncharacterized protein LY89DRAFT_722304 [Mollisia scopiformis]|uniref:Fungal-specific transcription factor domain-containing protein n=1 Tax=Mollisia scopiformis TaxID=149040 RepID=A0A194WV94_MOLSC|nr:uncharacterized protein LY89DRAFT_722304 [Mollisia scopiformis]KUJ11890.1 hypothetical protein LY89DRAFT_722304 [Mollisia scopiformis]
MASSNYSAGLHFVVSTPVQTLAKRDRKAIRKHATKARVVHPRKKVVRLWSWINPARELGSRNAVLTDDNPTPKSMSVPVPRLVGSYFSGLQLPPGVEPCMIQDLVKLIVLNKNVAYPYEICLDVHPVERGWFPYMISDICCLHSMMFSLRAFMEKDSCDQPSHFTTFHYAKTLQILQSRLHDFDKTSAISDSTIMVVITLATIAEISKDLAGVETHIKGLEKIVKLRGGVRALDTNNNMQVKVCRADLGYALLFGRQPLLFREGPSWDCFIADCGLIKCSHEPHDAIILAFAQTTLDERLHNVLRDVHAFSCISNVAYQTTRKLSPETYNEMTISILYRLTHLFFESDLLQEAIRLGLLVFSSTIFLQRHIIEQPYENLLNLYGDALLGLFAHGSSTDALPVPVILWLTILSDMVAGKEIPSTDRLHTVIGRASIESWSQASEVLRSIAWVDFIHEKRGKEVFEASVSQLRCQR